MCVHCYRVVIIYYYKVSHSREKKKSKINDVQGFDWLNRHLVYYLYIDEYDYMSQ